jgi:hypothetical protein
MNNGEHASEGPVPRVSWDRHEALIAALPPFLFTRFPVLLVGYICVVILGFPDPTPWKVSDDPLWNLMARWDTGWYRWIAEEGYAWSGRTDVEQNIVFFPALPLLMRFAGMLFGGRTLVGGFLVTLLAFLGALTYLYKLARLDMDRDGAIAALALAASYPYAVFYSAVYTESLFLLGVTGAFYHFRRRQLVRAGAWGLLVGLTRPNGFMLSGALGLMALAPAVDALVPRLRWPLTGQAEATGGGVRRLWAGLAAAAMPGLGLAAFLVFNYWLTGDPITWMRAVAAWGRSMPGSGPFGGLLSVAPHTPQEYFNAAAVLFAGVMLFPVARRFGAPYAAFTLLILAPPFVSGGLESMGRYTSVAFPLFLALASVTGKGWRLGLTIVFAMLQGLAAMMFFTWRPMY